MMPIPDGSACRQLHELMLATTAEADLATLAAHFETCPDCQQVDLALTALLGTYRQQEPTPLSPDLEARLIQHLCG